MYREVNRHAEYHAHLTLRTVEVARRFVINMSWELRKWTVSNLAAVYSGRLINLGLVI